MTKKNQPYTTADMIRDINSREYATDPNFRRMVEAKVAAGVSHGGTEVGNSGMVDFGRGGSNVGGVSVLIGSDHRHSGGISSTSIDPTATYGGEGFQSATDIADAIANPEYARNPAYREAVAWGISQMQPKDGPKF